MTTPLKRAREGAGLTQIEMAKRLKISQGHYSRIEQQGQTSRETAARIASLLPGVTEIDVLYPDRKPAREVAA
jgi:transcriptional regulator with XRE-family HTH domain